jgi:hypothetical protein
MPAQNGQLQLNIAGATGNISELRNAITQIDAETENLKKLYTELFQGAILGEGACAGTDFGVQLDQRAQASKDLILACIKATSEAVATTIGFDRGQFAGTAGY